MHEAFAYCWTDNKTGKIYVGSHKGSPADGYICSSKLMLQEYNLRPQDFTRQIIASGTFSDIRKFEEVLLKSEDAARNTAYYNQHNCDGKFYLKSHTEESKKKIGIANTGNIREDLSKRNRLGHNDETKKKLSENHHDVSGEKNPMFGKSHTEESKKKMSSNRKGKGKTPRSEETKLKMSLARKRYWDRKKGIKDVN